MQQDSKLEGWEVVSQQKEKELYFHTFEAFFGNQKNLAMQLTQLLSVQFYFQKKARLTFLNSNYILWKEKKGEWGEHQNSQKHEGMTNQPIRKQFKMSIHFTSSFWNKHFQALAPSTLSAWQGPGGISAVAAKGIHMLKWSKPWTTPAVRKQT